MFLLPLFFSSLANPFSPSTWSKCKCKFNWTTSIDFNWNAIWKGDKFVALSWKILVCVFRPSPIELQLASQKSFTADCVMHLTSAAASSGGSGGGGDGKKQKHTVSYLFVAGATAYKYARHKRSIWGFWNGGEKWRSQRRLWVFLAANDANVEPSIWSYKRCYHLVTTKGNCNSYDTMR